MKFQFYYAMSSFAYYYVYISLPGVKYYWQMMHTMKRFFSSVYHSDWSFRGKKCAYT